MEPQVLCQQLDKALGKVSLQHAGPSCWSALEGRTYDYFVMSGSVGQLTEGAHMCLCRSQSRRQQCTKVRSNLWCRWSSSVEWSTILQPTLVTESSTAFKDSCLSPLVPAAPFLPQDIFQQWQLHDLLPGLRAAGIPNFPMPYVEGSPIHLYHGVHGFWHQGPSWCSGGPCHKGSHASERLCSHLPFEVHGSTPHLHPICYCCHEPCLKDPAQF